MRLAHLAKALSTVPYAETWRHPHRGASCLNQEVQEKRMDHMC